MVNQSKLNNPAYRRKLMQSGALSSEWQSDAKGLAKVILKLYSGNYVRNDNNPAQLGIVDGVTLETNLFKGDGFENYELYFVGEDNIRYRCDVFRTMNYGNPTSLFFITFSKYVGTKDIAWEVVEASTKEKGYTPIGRQTLDKVNYLLSHAIPANFRQGKNLEYIALFINEPVI